MSNCIDNLHICKASCCKVIPISIECLMTKALMEYYRCHGVEVIRLGRNKFKLVIPSRCIQLTEDNKCRLHDSGDKPYLCRRFGDADCLDNYTITEGCIYGKEG